MIADARDNPGGNLDRPAALPARASRSIRLCCALVDYGLLLTPAAVVHFVEYVLGPVSAKAMQRTESVVGFACLAVCALQCWLVATTGQSLAKRWFRIEVVFDGGRLGFSRGIWLRSWVFWFWFLIPDFQPIVVGLVLLDALWIFGRESRCLHDYLASTLVVDISRGPAFTLDALGEARRAATSRYREANPFPRWGWLAIACVIPVSLLPGFGRKKYAISVQAREAPALLPRLTAGIASCATHIDAYGERHGLPPSSNAIPRKLSTVRGEPYQSALVEWAKEDAFRCAKFALGPSQRFVYQWQAVSASRGFAVAMADLDGDGEAELRFSQAVECASPASCTAGPLVEQPGPFRGGQPAYPGQILLE